VLFFYLKNDNVTVSSNKDVKEIFKDVSVKKQRRDKVMSSLSEVTRVRWHQHDGFERLVFDVTSYKTGNFELGLDAKNSSKLHGTLMGYRNFSATLPSFASSSIVKDMEVYTQGNSGYNFTLLLHRQTTYKVFLLQDPTRIVVDMQ
jgi:hypothetical protein